MNIVGIAEVLLISNLILLSTARSDSFDKPRHKKVLDLGRSQYLMPNDNRHVTVTCWYYQHFMIKEKNDPGLKGAELIALAPVQSGNLPKCLQASQKNEEKFSEWDADTKRSADWNGYFGGVKRDLILLVRPDGDGDGGMRFTVFKSDTQTKVFTDSVALESLGKRDFNFLPTSDHQITLRYLRVTSAGCSIPRSGESCWNKLRQQTGLMNTPIPKCTDYEGTWAGTAPSVIAYPVEVSLLPKPSIRPLGGPIRCYPSQ